MAEATRELPYPEIDIAAVRTYANGRANAASVRQIAGQIGMNHTSLEKFLAGSQPFTKNRILLCEWFLREHRIHPIRELEQVDVQGQGLGPEALVEGLLVELRGEARTEARLRITNALSQAYSRMGKAPPEWLYPGR